MAEKVIRRAPGGPGGRMAVAEKSKDIKKAYRNFFAYMGSFKWSILVAGILSLAGSILNLIGPSKLSDLTNLITAGLSGSADMPKILKICVTLTVLYVSGLLFNYFQGFIMATVSQKISKKMRTDISEKINRLPLKYFDTNSTGDILSRVTNDVDTVERSMNMSFSTLVSSAAMFIGSLTMMFLTNVVMAFSGVVSALAGFTAMVLIIRKSQVYFKRQQKELGDLNGHIEETYSSHDVVKAFNGEESERKKFHALNEKLFDSAWKSQFCAGIMMPLMNFIGNLAYVVVCIVGAVLAVNNSISFGTIVAFMLY
ncbi:MAG: ABC transporter ATP-binding protein, partial [Clostridia bacterium]|nr:ABC transporter ATP-binding protein [Clostridia bacterium]